MFRSALFLAVALVASAHAGSHIKDKKVDSNKASVEALEAGVKALQDKDYPTAVKEFSRAIEIGGMSENNEKAAHLNRGIAYVQIKDCPSAIPDFDKALEIGGDDALAYIQRAQCNAETGKVAAAIPDAKKAIEMMPDDASYATLLCAISFNAKVYAEAAPACETVVVRFDPQNAQLTQATAQSYDAIGNKAKAKEFWTKLLALDPSSEAAKQGIKKNS
jgi:tetratricopeptide (TPR) repeat protein